MATTTRPANLAAGDSSRDGLRLVSIVLAVIGLLITAYLTWSHISNVQTICPATSTFNCDLVQNSVYSKLGPIPVSYLGLAGYITILAVLLLEPRIPLLTERGKLITLGLTLFGVLFSGYLTYVEAFVLGSWCLWCVGSAIAMTLLFIVSFVRVWRDINSGSDEVEAEE
jgi:uncharacterized membrane protein